MGKRNNKKRKSWIVPLTAAVVVAMFGTYWLGPSRPVEIRQRDLEGIIRRNASIEKMIPGSSGRVYLIAQEHHYAGTTREGKDPNAKQQDSLPLIQSEIYHLLHDLCKEAKLSLVIGEGLGPKELVLPYEQKGFSKSNWEEHRAGMNDKAFSVNFLHSNPKETGYTLLEFFHPDLVTSFGANDSIHLSELSKIERGLFDLALKYIPTRTDYENPEKRRLLREAEMPLNDRKAQLNDERSIIYLNEGIARADELKKEDIAIVIGASHIPLMAKKYSGKRTLYVICPKSAAPVKLD